jgi:hypothetical protein
MSEAPTLNGQVIGQTERTTRALLEVLLAESGTPFETWVILNLTAAAAAPAADDDADDDDALALAALLDQLVAGLFIAEDEARALVEGVRVAGFLRGTDAVELTDSGRARQEQIQAGVADITRRLYDGFPREDLVLARQVLETLTERAKLELARQ